MTFPLSRRTIIRGSVGFLAALVFTMALVLCEQKRADTTMDDVLSAYLSDGILHDAHDWGTERGILIVLQREAQPPGMWRTRLLYPFDSRLRFPESSFLTRSSFTLANAIPSKLIATLHLPNGVNVVKVDRHDLQQSQASEEFQTRFPNNLGYIAVSRLGLNLDRTEAIFYVDHFCGLCGGGRYVLMRKVNESWKVVAEHYTWIS